MDVTTINKSARGRLYISPPPDKMSEQSLRRKIYNEVQIDKTTTVDRGEFIARFYVEKKANLYDFFMIKDCQTYSYTDKMKLIEVNVPVTDASNQEKVE